METMTHRRRAEIAAEKWSLFRPRLDLVAPDLFLNTMLDRRTWEACPIDCMESLGNIYGSRSQICCSKGKTYRDAQLGEHIHSVTVEYALEHEVVCRSEPTEEKRGESAVATTWWCHSRHNGMYPPAQTPTHGERDERSLPWI
jgi:hypothetical protein